MVGQGADRAGAHVGGGAYLEGDPVDGEVVEQRRVVDGGDPVADTVGSQVAQRVPDGLRPGGLTGVRDAAQAEGPGPGEHVGELGPRHADLGAAEPEGDRPRRRPPLDPLDRADRRLVTVLAGQVEHPADGDALVGGGDPTGPLQCLGEPIRGDAHHQVAVGGDGDLGVADVLSREVDPDAHRQAEDVVRAPHQAVHRDVDVDEVVEVGEPVEGGQPIGVGGDPPLGVTPRQLEHGVDRAGAEHVDVELRLGQPGDETADRPVRRGQLGGHSGSGALHVGGSPQRSW
jgi:hypothetical protein